MGESTRRDFVTRSAAAAAGMTVVGSLVAESADAKAAKKARPIVAYIHDASTGEISVNTGERTLKINDRQIAARIARAAG
jgi:hypothetical protein